MLQVLTDPDEEAILDGMMDLNTGSWSSWHWFQHNDSRAAADYKTWCCVYGTFCVYFKMTRTPLMEQSVYFYKLTNLCSCTSTQFLNTQLGNCTVYSCSRLEGTYIQQPGILVECQPPACRQTYRLHSEQIGTFRGEGMVPVWWAPIWTSLYMYWGLAHGWFLYGKGTPEQADWQIWLKHYLPQTTHKYGNKVFCRRL